MESHNINCEATPLLRGDLSPSLGDQDSHAVLQRAKLSSAHSSNSQILDKMFEDFCGKAPRLSLPARLRALLKAVDRTMSNVMHIDDYDLAEARELVAAFGVERYGYVVTPNVDHVIRHYDDEQFRALYAYAAYVLLDSRFLAHILAILKRRPMRVCLGSDLTQLVFSTVMKPHDVAILVGATAVQADELRKRFGLKHLHHVNPPMDFIKDREAVETCLRQIESVGPFRFCFLAVGSPQQELLASLLQQRGVARGLALCVGASINYMTGNEKRAPLWIQKLGCEWSYRLLQNPRRMAKRYLIRGPRIFWLLSRTQLRFRRPFVIPCERKLGSTTEGNAPLLKRQGQAL